MPYSGVSFFCPPSITIRETSRFEVKVGDEVFRLEGTDGNYPVSPELAIALRDAPPEQSITRMKLKDLEAQITNGTSAGTEEVWHIVYQNAETQVE